MKTVKIPDNMQPWSCTINGVKFVYEAGSTQTVPDEVADLISRVNGIADNYVIDKPWGGEMPDESSSGGGGSGGSGLPKPTVDDVGKVATVEEIPVIASVIVPEQTVTTEYDEELGNYRAVLNNIDASAFAFGIFVTMSVNGVTETGVVYLHLDNEDEPSGLMCELYDRAAETTYRFIKTENNTMLFDCYVEGGPYTVSVVEPTLIDTSTVVPEQTVTTEADEDEFTSAVLSNVDASKFVPDTPVVITINGVVFNTIAYEAYDGAICCTLFDDEMGEINCEYFVSENKMKLFTDTPGTYTVSLVTKAPKYNYEWQPAKPSSGILYCKIDADTGNMDKTWQEVYDAIAAGIPVFASYAASGNDTIVTGYYLTRTKYQDSKYWVGHGAGANYLWYADSPNDLLLADDW